MSSLDNKVYLAVNKGYSLPDIGNVETEAISFINISPFFVNDNDVAECKFTLESPSTVSLGVVGSVGPNQEMFFDKFEIIAN